MKLSSLYAAALASVWLAGAVASAQTAVPTVMSPAQVAVSQPLRNGHDDSQPNDRKTHDHRPLPSHGAGGEQDDALQTSAGPLVNAHEGTRFPGVAASGSAPPDANMAVGPNHILQTVNSRYAIYNKSGAQLAGPFSLSSLWSPLGSGNGCATNNGGDVVAQYDKLADRFIVTQLGGVSAPFSECIAISQTFGSSVALGVTGCPSGATCSLPSPVTPTATSALTVSTTAGTTTGTFTLTVTGSSGALVHTTTVALTVNPAAGDFTISASPSVLNVNPSSTGQYTVTIGAVNGSAPVNLSVSGLPAHTRASFNPNPANSPGTSTLSIRVSGRGVSGTNATLTITGNNGSRSHSATVTPHIN